LFNGEEASSDELVKVIEKMINKRLKISKYKKENETDRMILTEKENYNAEFGYIKHSQVPNTACGDNYKYIEMDEGNYIVGLSDGMGTGPLAERESRLVLEQIEKFIKLGFSRRFIINSINSII
jgi:stage II sporulation protein E